MDLVYFVAVSLDGFIAPPDGSVDWLTPFNNTGNDHGYSEFYAGVDGLIEGSRTYELELTFGPWPHGDKPCWVHTRRTLPIANPQVRLTAATPAEVAAQAAATGCRRVWLVGGGQIAGAYQAAGLISEYIISTIPVIPGGGIPLFTHSDKPCTLHLSKSRSYPSGIIQSHYLRQS
jgi:dihydrofolate reductase